MSRTALAAPVKSTPATTRSRSAGSAEMPESTTAMPIPLPVSPRAPPMPDRTSAVPIASAVTAIVERTTASPDTAGTSGSAASASSCSGVTSITTPRASHRFAAMP